MHRLGHNGYLIILIDIYFNTHTRIAAVLNFQQETPGVVELR